MRAPKARFEPDSNSELWWCTCELWYIYSKISCQNLIVGHGPTWILPWLLYSELFSANCFRWFTWNNAQWYGGYYTPKQCHFGQKKIRSQYYDQHIFSKIRFQYYHGDYIPHYFLGLFAWICTKQCRILLRILPPILFSVGWLFLVSLVLR